MARTGHQTSAVSVRLLVDPVACDGIGLCAQLAPGAVDLDRWGFPVLSPVLEAGDVPAARRAVRACPRRALWIEDTEASRRASAQR